MLERARREREAANRQPYSLDWLKKYLGHHLYISSFSQFHRDLAGDLNTAARSRNQKLNYRGPRGNAKTTIGTVGYTLWCIVEDREPFTLLLSEESQLSSGFIRSIKVELESNEDLARDYPEACGIGPTWASDHIVTRNGMCVMSRGAGGRIRGLKHLHYRPTLVILDDPNEKGDAFSPTTRNRKLDWLNKDVMSVGQTGKTNYVCYGTPLHSDAIVCVNSRSAMWKTRRYTSIVRWPANMGLWDQWERIRTNLATPDAEKAGREFYEANRVAMDEGAEVLWPERESLYDLMELRASIGTGAFGTEKQDEEGTAGSTEFPPEYFEQLHWFDEPPDYVVCTVISLDPSKGNNDQTGDYQAFVILQLTRDGTIWVEAEMRREQPQQMAWTGVGLCRRLGSVESFIVETNAGLGLILPEFERAMAEAGVLIPLDGIDNTDPKVLRIRRIGSYLHRKQIRFRNTPGTRLLVDQLKNFPTASYDDGPDALATGIRRLEQLRA